MFATQRLSQALRKGPGKAAASAAVVLALTLSLSGCGPADDGRVKLDFFQYKPEAVGQFEKIVADFEAANPGIDVVINNVPDPDTAIRTLLVKGKTPDVLTLNGNGNFGDLSTSCVFADLSELPAAKRVIPSVQDILDGLGTCHGSESNGLPFANNASGVLYNPKIFAKYGVDVPETWDDLIAAADTFKSNGVNPFYMTLKDAWTVLPSYVNLAGNLMPADFFDDVRSAGWTPATGQFSFEKDGTEAAAKLAKLFSYAQPGAESAGYNDGNAAFGAGESAMYLQGSFAIPAIRASNPEAKVKSFPYPTTNDPAKNTLVSGVDVSLAIGKDTKHPAEAKKFVEYLMSAPVLDYYSAAQSSLTPVSDAAASTDPALAGMQGFFNDGRVIGYFDHHVPASIPLPALLQQFVLDENQPAFLTRMDHEFEKVAARTTTKKGD
ncbi:ABC transporter substrate-binding protein [Arthrobacter glacialis]|uniref:Sugar ABC transporter substrate-binding protein n=1 Tax=Arthrobacter glacialis TaxID=1664 RepID=A0A2S3ZYX5_ARTGL|nr:extracellular solute-binding protein [Arthrobacter glacialis]POH74107.1 sugar ABC transporter substrate-binding protein [Arthrobacter glacialis]